MDYKITNGLHTNGSIESLRRFIDSFYGEDIIFCKDRIHSDVRETKLTFNSYAVAKTREEAISKWGFEQDTLGSAELTFDGAKKELDRCNQDGIKESTARVFFSTTDCVNIDWVKAVVKNNPDLEIKFDVSYSGCNKHIAYSFNIDNDYVEIVEEKTYSNLAEMYVSFLSYDIEDIFETYMESAKINLSKWRNAPSSTVGRMGM